MGIDLGKCSAAWVRNPKRSFLILILWLEVNNGLQALFMRVSLLAKASLLKTALEGIVWPKYHLFPAIKRLESMNMV